MPFSSARAKAAAMTFTRSSSPSSANSAVSCFCSVVKSAACSTIPCSFLTVACHWPEECLTRSSSSWPVRLSPGSAKEACCGLFSGPGAFVASLAADSVHSPSYFSWIYLSVGLKPSCLILVSRSARLSRSSGSSTSRHTVG